MADQAKKPQDQTAKKPAPAPKPGNPRPTGQTSGFGGSQVSKPSNPQMGKKY